MGLLALDQLVAFPPAAGPTTRAPAATASHPVRYFPFATFGINLTGFIVQLLDARLLDHRLYIAHDARGKQNVSFEGLSGTVRFDAVGSPDAAAPTCSCPPPGSTRAERGVRRCARGTWTARGRRRAALPPTTATRSTPGWTIPVDCVPCRAVRASTSALEIVAAVLLPLLGVAMLAGLVFGARHALRRARRAHEMLREAAEARDDRIVAATGKLSTLSFSMCFIPFDRFKAHGGWCRTRWRGATATSSSSTTLMSCRRCSTAATRSSWRHQWLGC